MNKVKYYRLISGLLLKDLSEKTGLCADCGTVWEVSTETYSEENLCPGCGGTNHRAATRSGMFFEIMRLLAEARERESRRRFRKCL